MRMLNRKTLDVAIVCSVAVAAFKITKALVSVVYLLAYQTDSCLLTAFLIHTAWLPSAIAYLAALFFAVSISEHLSSKRLPVIVILGVIAILALPLEFSVSPNLVGVEEAQAQQSALASCKDAPRTFSSPIRLQCYASANGIETGELVFDGDDITDVKLGVSQYDETDLLHLRLIRSASERLQRATSVSPESTCWVVFTTNHVFLTNSIIEEPIANGQVFVPMKSRQAASKLAEGINEFLYE